MSPSFPGLLPGYGFMGSHYYKGDIRGSDQDVRCGFRCQRRHNLSGNLSYSDVTSVPLYSRAAAAGVTAPPRALYTVTHVHGFSASVRVRSCDCDRKKTTRRLNKKLLAIESTEGRLSQPGTIRRHRSSPGLPQPPVQLLITIQNRRSPPIITRNNVTIIDSEILQRSKMAATSRVMDQRQVRTGRKRRRSVPHAQEEDTTSPISIPHPP